MRKLRVSDKGTAKNKSMLIYWPVNIPAYQFYVYATDVHDISEG